MRITLILLAFIWLCEANAFDFAGGSIEIPEGFEGPVVENMGLGTRAFVFTKPHQEISFSTLLQITIWDPEQEFPDLPTEDIRQMTESYLLQMLGGIQRARTEFEQDPVEFTLISDVEAARVNWHGKYDGVDVHGTMYALIHDSKIYFLHTQDAQRYEGKQMYRVKQAFENISLYK